MRRKTNDHARAIRVTARTAALLLAILSANPVLAQSTDPGQVTIPSSGVPMTPLPLRTDAR